MYLGDKEFIEFREYKITFCHDLSRILNSVFKNECVKSGLYVKYGHVKNVFINSHVIHYQQIEVLSNGCYYEHLNTAVINASALGS